jgi:hypothetical protein
MDKFIKRFRAASRARGFAWNRRRLLLPEGRIQVAVGTRLTRGTNFMGIDLAAMLEDHHKQVDRRSHQRARHPGRRNSDK